MADAGQENSSSILVIRGGAIGDFILTLPVLSALKKRFPRARIEVLGYPRIVNLAREGGLVEAVYAIESPGLAAFFARGGALSSEWRTFFSRFAVIVSYLYDPDGIFEGNVKQCTKAQFIAGPHRPDDSGELHASQVYLEPLERLTIFSADTVAKLRLPETSDYPSGKWLALHPGSGSETKNWPESNWRKWLEHLIGTTEYNLLLVGGETEGGRLHRLSNELPEERLEFADRLPLAELGTRLQACVGFVGHDSGITHLASALGLPVLALWGETCSKVWQPSGAKVCLLKSKNGLDRLGVSTVDGAMAALGLS